MISFSRLLHTPRISNVIFAYSRFSTLRRCFPLFSRHHISCSLTVNEIRFLHNAAIFLNKDKPPKRFEKFFKNKNTSSKQKADAPEGRKSTPEEPKTNPDKDFLNMISKMFQNPTPENENSLRSLVVIIGVLLAAYFLSSNNNQYTTITWKECTNYLANNLVESVMVINKSYVEVRVKSMPSQILQLKIGSVESFERNLEHVQNELQIPFSNRVFAQFQNRLDAFTLLLYLSEWLFRLLFLVDFCTVCARE